MYGIDVNGDIVYKLASLRYFERDERHVARFCTDNVLLMVFDGVLRFREGGVEYEVSAGEYFIQRKNMFQDAVRPSDSPKYLYVHFDAEWREEGDLLARRGSFDVEESRERMTRLDRLAHSGASKLELSALFLEILSSLYKSGRTRSVAQGIAAFLASKRREEIDLALLSSHFHFSKNHIINLFKSEYGVTPMEYLDRLRLQEAQWLLESSAASVEDIAYDCGFGSYSNFYRRFCAYCGSSPRQWRDEKRRALEKRLEEQEK